MTTNRRIVSRPWKDFLYPRLRNLEHAKGYLQVSIEENEEYSGQVRTAFINIIQANHHLPWLPFILISQLHQYITEDDIDILIQEVPSLASDITKLKDSLRNGSQLNPRIEEPEYKSWLGLVAA